MTEYCTRTHVENRLTKNGLKYVGDRNRDGFLSEAEKVAYIDSAIERAGSDLDILVEGKNVACNRDVARAQAASGACTWLRHRAIDIAVWYATSQGGRTVPESFENAYAKALALMQDVEMGATHIPGLIYTRPMLSCSRTARLPVVVNYQ